MPYPKEPTSKDDYPDDRIVTASPIEFIGENVSLNYMGTSKN